jgi:hypothetical protein
MVVFMIAQKVMGVGVLLVRRRSLGRGGRDDLFLEADPPTCLGWARRHSSLETDNVFLCRVAPEEWVSWTRHHQRTSDAGSTSCPGRQQSEPIHSHQVLASGSMISASTCLRLTLRMNP